MPKQTTKIYVAGKVVGAVYGKVFTKRISYATSALRKPPALALDESSLDDAEAAGATFVEIYCQDTRKTFRAPISTIRAKGLRLNRGYGKQIALLLGDWNQPEEAQLGLGI